MSYKLVEQINQILNVERLPKDKILMVIYLLLALISLNIFFLIKMNSKSINKNKKILKKSNDEEKAKNKNNINTSQKEKENENLKYFTQNQIKIKENTIENLRFEHKRLEKIENLEKLETGEVDKIYKAYTDPCFFEDQIKIEEAKILKEMQVKEAEQRNLKNAELKSAVNKLENLLSTKGKE